MRLDILKNLEKKEKIFLIVCALYVIVAECLLTYCKTLTCLLEIVVGGVLVFLMFMKSRKLYIGIREVLVLGTYLLFCIFKGNNILFALHGVIAWFIYIYMTNFFMYEGIERKNVEKVMWGIIIVLTAGFTVHAIVDTAFFLRIKDFSSLASMVSIATIDGSQGNYWRDVFNRRTIPRTHLNYYLVPIFACTLPAFISKIRPRCKVLIAAIDIFSLFGIVCSGMGRGPFIIFLAVILFQYVVLKNVKHERTYKPNLKIVFGVIIVFCLLAIGVGICLLLDNEFRATTVFFFTRGGGLIHSDRFRYQSEVIRNIFKYPFGLPTHDPLDVYDFKFAHNVWLDIAMYAGVIPFILFTIYTIYSLVDIYKYIKSNASFLLKLTIGGLYVGYLISYSMNPALNVALEFIVPWLIINTMVHTYNKSECK